MPLHALSMRYCMQGKEACPGSACRILMAGKCDVGRQRDGVQCRGCACSHQAAEGPAGLPHSSPQNTAPGLPGHLLPLVGVACISALEKER